MRIAIVENGATWTGALLDRFRLVHHRKTAAFGGADPVETFKRHFWVSPDYDDDIAGLVELLGADRVLFGSDFPHPEGLANPVDFAKEATALTDEDRARVMSENLKGLLRAQDAF